MEVGVLHHPGDDVIRDLDARWIDPATGRIRLLPAREFNFYPWVLLRTWMHLRARYCLPTVELVDWLKAKIAGRSAIEVGSGNGDLGFHLGIPETDSCIQQTPELLMFYHAHGQIPTRPRPECLKMDAETAVKKLKPQVVVASWLTRKFIAGTDREGAAQASIYGVSEKILVRKSDCYIHVGNEKSHGEKTILKTPHEEIRIPGMVSRGNPELDVIYVWGK
jgi:hypothetical protein